MKVIVITGSTRGIGYGLAQAFIEKGHAVVLSGRYEDSVTKALEKLTETMDQRRLFGQVCDVSHPEQVQLLWDGAVSHFGQVDIWINNAGLANDLMDFHLLAPEEIARVIDTNVLGTLYGSRVALKGFLGQGSGALYNMEGLGSNGRKQAGLILYGTSKAAIRYFNDALFEETEGTPVIAAAISPGMIWTDMVSDQFKDRPEAWERNKGVLNIIMDRVETVAPWLAEQILTNETNGARITWLSRRKLAGRFISAPFKKRQVVD